MPPISSTDAGKTPSARLFTPQGLLRLHSGGQQFAEYVGKLLEKLRSDEIRQFQLHLLTDKETYASYGRRTHVCLAFSL